MQKTSLIKIFLCLIIVVCSFSSVYSDVTDYEYTNILEELAAEGQLDQEASDGNISPINSIGEQSTDRDTMDTILNAEESGTIDETDVEFSNFNIVTSYEYMHSINTDTIGWLFIPNMGSYPVMYSGDNSYYLNHSSTKYEFENGAIFMNADSAGSFENMSLIHGHHLRSGGMFGSLKKYKDTWFFQNNDLIEVYDGKELRYFRPFSVFYYEDGVEYIKQNITDQNEKTEYAKSLMDRSMVSLKSGLTLDFSKDIMILSTCDYEFENCRLGVACVEILSVQYQN